MENELNIKQESKVFNYRLDYYWKSLSIYSIILSILILIEELIPKTSNSNSISQPFIFLMVFFVIITTVALVFQMYKKKSMIISEEGITFSFRNKNKFIKWDEIIKISFVKDNFKESSQLQLIRIKVNKYRFFLINPSTYENENEIVSIILNFKNKFNK